MNDSTNTPRRNFLRLATVASSQALEPIQRTGRPLLKPALNAYLFLGLLNAKKEDASKGIDLFGVCDFCAKHHHFCAKHHHFCAKHHLEAVDLTGYFSNPLR